MAGGLFLGIILGIGNRAVSEKATRPDIGSYLGQGGVEPG
jgi:hypothetical protein